MTILELIIAQCAVQGVDKKHAERIEKISGITEEKDGNIIAAVKNFKENVMPAIEEAETSGKTLGAQEYEKKHNIKDGKPVEEKKEEPKDDPKLPENIDPGIKALIEAQNKSIENLTGIVTGMVKSQKDAVTSATVREKLKGKVDDKFIERVASEVNLEAEDIEKEIEARVTSFNELRQSILNDSVGNEYIPAGGKPAGDRSVEDWAKLMESDDNSGAGVVDLGIGK